MDTGSIIALIAFGASATAGADSSATSPRWLDVVLRFWPLILLGCVMVWGIIVLVFKAGGLVKTVDKTETRVEKIEKKVDAIIEFLLSKGLVAISSPRTLTNDGRKLLEESGVKEIVDERFDEVLNGVRTRTPKNAYQAEAAVIEVVRALAADPQALSRLQNGAFKSGVNVELLLYIGAIYIRDKVLAALDLLAEDIDKQPSANNPA